VTSTRAITASGESSLKVWDTKSQEHPLVHTFTNAHPLGAHHVVVDVDSGGSTAASSGFGQELVTWDLLEGKQKAKLEPICTSFLSARRLTLVSNDGSTVDGSEFLLSY
jgi:hypothetical protein